MTRCPLSRRRLQSALLVALVLLSIYSWATMAWANLYDPPPGYYDQATGTGAVLKDQLTTAMSAGHIERTYGDFRYSAPVTDADPDHPGNILLVYNRASVPGNWDSGLTWNREHVWPQSRQPGSASNSTRGNLGDPHALRPANPSINSSRGNKPYGFEATDGSFGSLGDYYFPGDADKGDVARQLFYSDTRYASSGLSLTDSFPTGYQMGDLSALVAWHYLDPPDEFERRRNQTIYSQVENPAYYSNNRNAYIDRPEYVWSVYVDQQNDSRLTVGGMPDADGGSALEVDLGPVLVGADVPAAQNVTLLKDGFDGTYFEVTASGDATASLLGRYNAFATGTGGSDSTPFTAGLNTSTSLPGQRTGSLKIDNLDVTLGGGTGRGGNDGDDWIHVSLDVLDHADASFDRAGDHDTLVLDFGTVTLDDTPPILDFDLFNRTSAAGFTAALELDAIVGSGDLSILTTDLVPFVGATALAAGSSNHYMAALDTSSAGNFSASYTLSFSDVDLPGAGPGAPLTLLLAAIVESDSGAGLTETADFDQDTDLDGTDLLTWQRGLGLAGGANLEQGDANGDHIVDASDLAVWRQQFGTTVATQTVSVPEPATLLLMALALMAVGGCRKCSRSRFPAANGCS